MISSIYVAYATNRLDLELKIIRHFLLNSRAKKIRDSFIATEMSAQTQSMEHVLAQKPDRGMIDDLLAQTVLRNQEIWLKDNLHHLTEFSEKRLNQMELILRYTLFEGFLAKIVGNILWEYPKLRLRPIHARLSDKPSHKRCCAYHERRLQQHPDRERIAWTIATVEAVDHLPFDQGQEETAERICLRTYLNGAFGLASPEKQLWPTLERLRKARNRVIHKNLELGLLPDTMKDISKYFGGFPTILIEAAATKFPEACTIEKPEPGDDGTPGYISSEEFF